jgi:2,5-diamino-6-(ribosylamino)-4(3H)-pyrimidinone 5'-phosphate reductase
MKPRVILHNAVSADGRLDWFRADIGLYYELAGRFNEDLTLVGSQTLLASPDGPTLARDPAEIPEIQKLDPQDSRPILVVPDSRGRIKNWVHLRTLPFWRDVFALGSSTTPQSHINRLNRQGVSYFLSGRTKVDLERALHSLQDRFGSRTVRVDGGGTLNGVLLRAGLVDEISLLVHPQFVGGVSPRSVFRASDLAATEGLINLDLIHNETLAGGVVWLRYRVVR